MAAQAQAAESAAAPDFSLQDLQSNSFTLSNYINKQPVMLLFWATWCPFCREELKNIALRFDHMVNDGVKFAAVDVGESPARVSAYCMKYQYSFPVLLDTENRAAQAYEILGIPTYILIDKQGVVRQVTHTFPEAGYKKILDE
jgi:peroxiredoxin